MRIKRREMFPNIEFVQKEMERLFNDMLGPYHASGMFCSRDAWRPPTDVYETKDGLVVKMELAGMREHEIEVVLDERTLLISGVRPDDRPPERIAYHQMGINYGPFCIQVFLPWSIQEEGVSANYEDGLLKIHLPCRKREAEPSRRIEIQVQEEQKE